ncbi:tetratricopeptide repeat protein [Companilactobacillus mishanensis]|uniref:Tetratricopeptide repeat protein n=1 Tax=Companilactobacillus mishanensis TaxID=2486008 RepID=A0A5P0ZH26_9LACO|nr:tetratricopeptide repeat protein [Companilactobacillus mishanensis]MQS44092.1 tetratricopeptide repeat protein [Companilactobacillus mishanensis]MQS52302.1 tetratricopeptide repeat protein [Companilactobacillus mishanensis]MQS88392.1 tetratricopeptide repeat protein [Companilactobacillus mishanensis]
MDDSDNLKKILEQADDAFEKGNWEDAVDFYSRAYGMKQSFSINQGLAAALLNQKNADQAESVILDYFNYYLSDPEAAQLAVDIVIENNDYLLANQMIHFYAENKLSTIEDDFIDNFKTRVKISEDRHSRSFTPKMKIIVKKINSIVTLNVVDQIQLIRSLREFDKEHYLSCTKLLIQNPLLHPLLKSEVIENLFKLGIDEELKMSFYGENKTCNPARLKPIMSSDVYLSMCDELEKLIANSENQVQLENLRSELSLYAALVYPFGSEIIKTPELWTKVFLLRYGLLDESQVGDDPGLSDVEKWIDRFDSLINTFQQ